jgi:serine/threonine protein kinase
MIGKTVSHYRIIERLGEGGMGVVYLAEDTVLGRQVAIKTLANTSGPGNQHFRTRFLREARAVSALSHPHIAAIHDYGETAEGQPYIVMEYVRGETLGELMLRETMTIPRAVEIITEVAEALAEAHSLGIIHRDIKPSNSDVSRVERLPKYSFLKLALKPFCWKLPTVLAKVVVRPQNESTALPFLIGC